MGRWSFLVVAGEPAPPTVPQSQLSGIAGGSSKASTMAAAPRAVDGHQAKIRELLRLEFECAADASLSKGNLIAAKILRKLANTTRDVEVSVLYDYAQLLDDISGPAVSSDELRQIGIDWFPKNATEYVERLASVRMSARPSVCNKD